MSEGNMPDFSGKIVIFYVESAPAGLEGGILMEYVELQVLEGRKFLVGRVPSWAESQWVARVQGGVAWDSVVHYLVFDSREDYQQRVATAKQGVMGKLFGK